MDRLIVGITGASGTPLACRFVNQLKEFTECEVHVVASDSALLTAQYEAPDAFKKMLSCADVVHDNASIGESIASGTFKTTLPINASLLNFLLTTAPPILLFFLHPCVPSHH